MTLYIPSFVLKGKLFRIRVRVTGNWKKVFVIKDTFPQGTVTRIKLPGVLITAMVSYV